MECVEARAALKSSSFISEVVVGGMKPSSNQYLVDNNIWCVGGTFVEDFAIEEYFDISAGDEDFVNEEEEEEEDCVEEEEDEEVEKRSSSSSSSTTTTSCSMSLSPMDCGGGVVEATELAIPEDMKELETWANLMDDSIPDDEFMPLPYPINYKPNPNPISLPITPQLNHQQLTNSTTTISPFPAKPRTSGIRKPGSAWTHSHHHLKPELPISSSSSSTGNEFEFELEPKLNYSSEESGGGGFIFIPNPIHITTTSAGPKPVKKKQKIIKPTETSAGSTQLRRCTHCQVQKTPQWRTGPLGPKTLCNACGVRFKSGRLFPEYRPACSPTFSSEVHSNSHRKVLEMRKNKDNGDESEEPVMMTIMSC